VCRTQRNCSSFLKQEPVKNVSKLHPGCTRTTHKEGMRCTALTKGYETDRVRRAGPRCKRNCADGTDFCKQHNPVNKLDDATCAICLDEINNPIKLYCAHVFCKDCLHKSVLHGNIRCPCCRGYIDNVEINNCIRIHMGKHAADKFQLEQDIALYPWKWCKYPWTKSMTKKFFKVYQEGVDVEQWKNDIKARFFDESGRLIYI